MTMTKQQFEKLIEYIDARIAEKSEAALNSSDGGLIETMRRSEIEAELRELLVKD